MIFVNDLKNPEGPVLLPDGNWALVEMHPDRGWVLWLAADGKSRRVLARTGRPNGLTIDRHGVLWVAESLNPPSLLRLTMDGKVEPFASGDSGGPFLFPNDLVFGPDGALYMTDSGVRIADWRSIPPDQRETTRTDGRVFRIDVRTRSVKRLDSGLNFANGIVFGPDGHLYVATTQDGNVWRYPLQSGGDLGRREFFANIRDDAKTGRFRGPDGMKFGVDGNLYVAAVNQGDVTVVGADGKVIRRIQLAGPGPTNVCFGPPGTGKIYVTEQGVGNFEVHDVDTDGVPLFG
jgi:gluconolactonase